MTDDRDLEDSVYGWYGQIGVLMVYTFCAYCWFCFIFVVVLLARAFYQRKFEKEDSAEVEMSANNYYSADNYQAPQVQVT